MSREEEGRAQSVPLRAAAADLIPLAQRILAISNSMKGPGYVDLPVDARAFFICAACLGVGWFLEEALLAPREMEAAAQLAPEIARQLRLISAGLGSEPVEN